MGLFNFKEFSLNESNISIWDKHGEDLPSIFKSTIYRLPTQAELEEFENFDLTGQDVFSGFSFTIIGKGIKNLENKKMIADSIKLLCDMYPENKEYKAAFIQATANKS